MAKKSKEIIVDQIKDRIDIETKAIPQNFGNIQSLIMAPAPIMNDAPSIMRLFNGWSSICINKVAQTLLSLPLNAFVTKSNRNYKTAFNTKKLPQSYQSIIKKNSRSLIIKQAEEIEQVTEHNLYDILNNVNQDLNWSDLLMMTIQYLLMIGNAYWGLKRDKKGNIYGIEILPAEYTMIILNKDNMEVEKYRVYNGIREKIWEKDDIIHFKKIAPGMFWRLQSGDLVTGLYGMGAVEQVLPSIMLMNGIDDYERALFENMCIPSGIVKYTQGTLTNDQIRQAETNWKKAIGGAKRAGNIKVTDQNFEFQALSLNPKDLSYQEGRKWLREVISNSIGVPMSLITPDESNKASSTVAIQNYMQFTIFPLTTMIQERITTHLCPQFDKNLFVQFQNPVAEDNEYLLKEMEVQIKLGAITINEWRAEQGKEPLEWGDSKYSDLSTHIKDDIKDPNIIGDSKDTIKDSINSSSSIDVDINKE